MPASRACQNQRPDEIEPARYQVRRHLGLRARQTRHEALVGASHRKRRHMVGTRSVPAYHDGQTERRIGSVLPLQSAGIASADPLCKGLRDPQATTGQVLQNDLPTVGALPDFAQRRADQSSSGLRQKCLMLGLLRGVLDSIECLGHQELRRQRPLVRNDDHACGSDEPGLDGSPSDWPSAGLMDVQPSLLDQQIEQTRPCSVLWRASHRIGSSTH